MFHLYLPDKRRLEAERNGNGEDCAGQTAEKKSLSVWGDAPLGVKGEREVADDRRRHYVSSLRRLPFHYFTHADAAGPLAQRDQALADS